MCFQNQSFEVSGSSSSVFESSNSVQIAACRNNDASNCDLSSKTTAATAISRPSTASNLRLDLGGARSSNQSLKVTFEDESGGEKKADAATARITTAMGRKVSARRKYCVNEKTSYSSLKTIP